MSDLNDMPLAEEDALLDVENPGIDTPQAIDPGSPQAFGKLFIGNLYKILKVGSIYSIDHQQTRQAIESFLPYFEDTLDQTGSDAVSIALRGELAIVNGETLRLKRREQERLNELHELFAKARIRGIMLERGLATDHLVEFLSALNNASTHERGLIDVNIEHVVLVHGDPDQSVLQAISEVNKAMYVTHVYIRALVKTRNMHQHVQERGDAKVPTGMIRRIMQTISDILADEDFTILGLLPLRLAPADSASHSVNAAIYAMLLADRLGLPTQLVSYAGMAVIYQDIDRLVGVSYGYRDRDQSLDPKSQFATNLRDIAKMLDRLEGDIISTLRVLLTYERGNPINQPLTKPYYRQPRSLHIISRLVDVCRTYDLLIQGLDGYKRCQPDLAIQYIENRTDNAFDKALVELLVSTLGMYPIGTTVHLSTGERAVVVRTPEPASDAARPVVRVLSEHNPSLIDLSNAEYQHISILKSIEVDESELSVSNVYLLT